MKIMHSHILKLIVLLILANVASFYFYTRIDLTEDGRYSLSNTTEAIVKEVQEIVQIKVYLQGDFPSEFKRLQTETKQLLEEFRKKNKSVQFRFINPVDIGQELINSGLTPSRLQVQENGKYEELVIFPWAVVQHGARKESVSLLKDIFSNSQNEQLEASIENLEYAFTNAIHSVTSEKSKKIAVLKGNGELPDANIADFLLTLNKYYHIAPFTLDSLETVPQKSLDALNSFDLIIVAKPTEKFSEKEKYGLDQYIMNGGKSLWLIDNVHAELDSLMDTGEALVYARDLGLTDFFFSYGLRINSDLITDLYCSEIPLATGNVGNNTQFEQFPWMYHPLVSSLNNHAINSNTEAVNLKFANSIELLNNSIDKTVLLQSSPLSKTQGTPSIVALKTIAEKPDQKEFSNGNQILGVLLQGSFKSAYSNRVAPFNIEKPISQSIDNQIIVISDGDIISNDFRNGSPLPLGVDKWSNIHYGNKDFLLNAVNYLLDDQGLVSIRSKKINLQFLDKQRAYSEALKWQLINLFIPLIILASFGLIYNQIRKRKYN